MSQVRRGAEGRKTKGTREQGGHQRSLVEVVEKKVKHLLTRSSTPEGHADDVREGEAPYRPPEATPRAPAASTQSVRLRTQLIRSNSRPCYRSKRTRTPTRTTYFPQTTQLIATRAASPSRVPTPFPDYLSSFPFPQLPLLPRLHRSLPLPTSISIHPSSSYPATSPLRSRIDDSRVFETSNKKKSPEHSSTLFGRPARVPATSQPSK
jgi:hypothetical protein